MRQHRAIAQAWATEAKLCLPKKTKTKTNNNKTLKDNLDNIVLETGKDFIMKLPKAIATKAKNDKLDLIKLKELHSDKNSLI